MQTIKRAVGWCLSLSMVCPAVMAEGLLAQVLPTPWAALQAQADRQGLQLEAAYSLERVQGLSGGAGRGGATLGLFDLTLTLDAERRFGLPGLSAFAHVLRSGGADPSALIGDAQGVSNIAASTKWRLFEIWVQQNFVQQRASLLAGRFDLNAEFYRLPAADLFLHSSFGIGPAFGLSGRGGPSIYPESAVGVRFELRPEPFVLRLALLNGVPVNVPRADGTTGFHRRGDGLLLVAEADLLLPDSGPANAKEKPRRWRVGRAAEDIVRDTKLGVGLWYYTAKFDDLTLRDAAGNAQAHRGSAGAYLIGEHVLYRDSANASRLVRGFAQLGLADGRVNRFGAYLGGGLTLTAPFKDRGADEVGIAFASARNGTPYREQQTRAGAPTDRAETTIEFNYLAQMTPWFSVQPAFQYVINPGTNPALRNAQLLQLRLQFAM